MIGPFQIPSQACCMLYGGFENRLYLPLLPQICHLIFQHCVQNFFPFLQVQFSLIFVHAMQLFVFECDFPKWIALLVIPNAIFFCYMFGDFYKKAYSLTRKHVGLRIKSDNNNNTSASTKAPNAGSTVNHKLSIGFSLKKKNKKNVS